MLTVRFQMLDKFSICLTSGEQADYIIELLFQIYFIVIFIRSRSPVWWSIVVHQKKV